VESADTNCDTEDLRQALDKVLQSDGFQSSPNASAFLSFVVERTIANEADTIKGYTIAVDSLGRPESFNPQEDPLVRVLATRVRSALDDYYAADGKEEAFRIDLPKGKYVPRLIPNRVATSEKSELDVRKPLSWRARLARYGRSSQGVYTSILLVALLTTFAFSTYLSLQKQPSDPADVSAGTFEGLVVEVSSFSDADAKTLTGRQAQSIRQQLISDISKFRDIRVRDSEASNEDGPSDANRQQLDFRISGSLLSFGKHLGLTIAVSDATSRQLLWSENAQVPNNDAGYNNLTARMARNAVTKLAGPSGIFQTEMEKRLRLGSNRNFPKDASSYECLVSFRAFDRSKRRELKAHAASCLEKLTRQDTVSSSVWAAFALTKLFEWGTVSPSDDTLVDLALSSAEKSIQLDPLNSFGYEVKGKIELARGECEKAEASFRHAIQLNPLKPRTHVLLGWARALKGEWDDGIEYIKRAIERAPSPAVWFKIPLVIDAYKRADYMESLSMAEEILSAGDERGAILAIPPAMQLGKLAQVRKHRSIVKASGATDPLQELRRFFNDPESMQSYTEMLLKARRLNH